MSTLGRRFSTASSTSLLSGAAPQPSRSSELRSYWSTSGCLARKTINGGASEADVTRYFWMVDRKSVGSNLGSDTIWRWLIRACSSIM
uniref:Putative secreted protein n=1 Tax=Anopheles darlingi TaxID=43151 RepID=A0A2M4DC65_ANODA